MRGITWLAAAVTTLHDLGDFEDAALVQQRVAACFAAFVTDVNGSANAVGDQSTKDPLLEELEPGQINYLDPGQDISFATPPVPVSQDFGANAKTRIAAATGVTPEGLTGKYTGLPFSAARMSRIRFQANVDVWRWHMLIPQMCDGVWRWVMELAAALNGWPEVPTAEWTPPPMPVLDPAAETKTFRDSVRSGKQTLPEALRADGVQDPSAHLKEIADANKLLDDLEIVLDSDPRKVSLAGQEQPSETQDTDST
jgi:capsid protein